MTLSPRMRALLAQAVVDKRYGFTSPSSYAPLLALADIFPEAKAEVEEIERHLDRVDAEREDPVAQFERLAGRTLNVDGDSTDA
ncbi:hypothetical protein [Rubricoccus marinus]|nr:hypothetical protein [Rubricoccus marinus]